MVNRRPMLMVLLIAGSCACSERAETQGSTELGDDALSLFLEVSHEQSFERACSQLEALCGQSANACGALEFFCRPATSADWVCMKLRYACRDGQKSRACSKYDEACTRDDLPPAGEPTPDASVPIPADQGSSPDLIAPSPADAGTSVDAPPAPVDSAPLADTGAEEPGSDSGSPGIPRIEQPVCAWNQAYEENGKEDSVAAILANARGCYVLIDPFSSTQARSAIAQLKNAANIVGCYISVGSCEDWRADYSATKPFCGPAYPGWDGEYFVTDTAGILPLMKARIDKMANWGCNYVEFDNMDWALDSGNRAGVSPSQARAYNQALCAHTRAKGMRCMAKSTTDGAEDFDGLTVESYTDDQNWWSTAELKNILAAQKIGLIVHYNDSNCDGVYANYKRTYGSGLSFICSDRSAYRHYNSR